MLVAGERMHRSMPGLQRDMQLRIRGFISQAGYRSGTYQLLLHAEQIEHIE